MPALGGAWPYRAGGFRHDQSRYRGGSLISTKTVEANLARQYRKLGIHVRAELGHDMARAGK
jgi:hypothetical protein